MDVCGSRRGREEELELINVKEVNLVGFWRGVLVSRRK